MFRHALIREAVHEDLLPGEHGRLHDRFARAIAASPQPGAPQPGADRDGAPLVRGAQRDMGADHRLAGRGEARRALAHAERLTLVARVLELWDQVPDAAERIGAGHAQVLEEAVAAAYDAGEVERGIALATRGAEGTRSGG